ncbi:MAG: thiamine pyrophosphate-binding protein [Bacteroidetes bacterium]|nr:thiamine pyrophosphate-binding protein [Bacteroidota bacterium]MDA0937572.1 thiamine pyrophosphate-binding protein [Bacteroidota bacterium]MDA1345029.1 thiamine pyrophosphate-binding protein [Bacteroidota bacterium]
MRFTVIPLPQTVVHYCQVHQITHIVISAGSRNAPLTNGFVENPYFKTYSVVDERAAAFFALGIAQQKKQPVALVCTSGSALLNYYPAVAEAYYSDIPLVVLSADRMPHRIDIGDGQTINQNGVFEPHLEGFAKLKPDVIHATQTLLDNPHQRLVPPQATPEQIAQIQEENQRHNEIEIDRILRRAIDNKGPVHLNIPMEEPLYQMTDTPLVFKKIDSSEQPLEAIDLELFKKQWAKAKRKMILIGTHPPDGRVSGCIQTLAKDPSVLILSEVNSNINGPGSIQSIDTLLAPLEQRDSTDFEKLKPELLLTFGGMIVSKKIKAFLRKHPAQQHWHIDSKKAYDTFYQLTEHIRSNPINVLEHLAGLPPAQSGAYQMEILHLYNTFQQKGKTYLSRQPFSDLKVFECLQAALPKSIHLQLANSSTIRYAQLFPIDKTISVNCNRGTSGIDGSTATAVGAAVSNMAQTLLITGDLSFFYDINGLWNNYIPSSFRVIILNNGGGGIFRILPGDKDTDKYDTYFETIHHRNAKHISKAFGFKYQKVDTMRGLRWRLMSFFKPSKRPKILEIQTPRTQNDVILQNYFKAMADKN